MELSQLRYFATAARLEHITRAAALLHIAQPALTKSIHNLERELGVQLIAARGRNIVLTDCGRYLYERLREPLRLLDGLPGELARFANQSGETVRLNVRAASTAVTEAIIAYKKRNPDVHFVVRQMDEARDADVAVATIPGGGSTADFKDIGKIFKEQLFVAVPASSPLAARENLRLAELADEEFISFADSKQFRGVSDALCRQAGFLPNIVFESDSPATVRNLIAVGSGVGFWPAHTWGEAGREVRLIEISEPLCTRELVLCDYTGRPGSAPAAADFFRFLSQWFDDLFGSSGRN